MQDEAILIEPQVKKSKRGTAANRAIVCLLVLGVLYTMYFARSLLLPIFLAALISALLHPLVRQLNKFKIPDGVGAVFVLAAMIAIVGVGVQQLSDPATEWINRAPYLIRDLEFKLHPLKDSIKEAKEATEKIEKMTDLDGEEAKAEPKISIKQQTLAEMLFTNTQSFVVNSVIILVLIYFILARGRKTLESVVLALADMEKGRKLYDLLSQIQHEITLYLGTITIINAILGALTALTLFLLDFPNPLLWGAVAGTLNFIPYIGSVVTITSLTVVSYLSFESWWNILPPPLLFFCYTAIEGQFITPLITGRRLVLNPIMIFISIVFWSWAWGIFGVLLAVPILATLKIVSKNVNSLKVLHALL